MQFKRRITKNNNDIFKIEMQNSKGIVYYTPVILVLFMLLQRTPIQSQNLK